MEEALEWIKLQRLWQRSPSPIPVAGLQEYSKRWLLTVLFGQQVEIIGGSERTEKPEVGRRHLRPNHWPQRGTANGCPYGIGTTVNRGSIMRPILIALLMLASINERTPADWLQLLTEMHRQGRT